MIFRLSPGLTSGRWSHDAVVKLLTLALNFAGCEPATLHLTGDIISRTVSYTHLTLPTNREV